MDTGTIRLGIVSLTAIAVAAVAGYVGLVAHGLTPDGSLTQLASVALGALAMMLRPVRPPDAPHP